MAYRLKMLTDVQATPSNDAERFGRLGNGVVLFGTGNKFQGATPTDSWVNVLIPPGIRDGWIPLANCNEIPDPEPAPVDRESFVRQCILVERIFNNTPGVAPWYISTDFLLARAIFETNVTAVMPTAGSDARGPLRVSSAEWKNYLDNGGTAAGFSAADRIYPMVQVRGAGYRMHADAKAISAAKPKDLTAVIKDDPYLPSYLDIFHAYLTDAKAAIAIGDAQADQTKTMGGVLSAPQVAAVAGRSQFNGITAATKVPDFVAKTEGVLNAALKSAFDDITKFAPDELPQDQLAAASWFGVAKEEMKANVTEKSQPDRIKSYFAATDFGKVGPADPIPHWCGAFAAHCMKQSGNGSSVPKGAAVAANWKTFGQNVPAASDKIPVGAVVVLNPGSNTGTSGHVAFFASSNAKNVILLGGNQSDSVNETPFAASRVAAVRWLETAPSSAGAAAGKFNFAAAGVPPKFFKFGDLIVDKFARAGFTEIQQLAAIANAIGESGLNPEARAVPPEQSFGLFQCNQKAGLGIGFTVQQLMDPEVNIGIIMKEAKKFKEFMGATTVAAAVEAFVRFIERPKDTAGQVNKRMGIASKIKT